jgi:mevalonate kinase
MITENMRNLWLEGIESQDFYIKICGAGGGGFFLGFAKDWDLVQPYLAGYSVEKLY